jgi:hypothetical protein
VGDQVRLEVEVKPVGTALGQRSPEPGRCRADWWPMGAQCRCRQLGCSTASATIGGRGQSTREPVQAVGCRSETTLTPLTQTSRSHYPSGHRSSP